MFSTQLKLALSLGFLRSLVAGAPTVDPLVVGFTNPTYTVCSPAIFTWSGGTPPYTFNFTSPVDPDAAPYQAYGPWPNTNFVWEAAVPPGDQVELVIEDSTGEIAVSTPWTMTDQFDKLCLPDPCVGGHGTGTCP